MPRSTSAAADATILEIARRHDGVVARAQLLAAGVTSRQIERRLSAGRLSRVHRGVYTTGPVTGPHARELAALLACGVDCHLSHRSAAGAWGLLKSQPGRPVAIVTRRDVRLRDPGIRIHRVARLGDDEVTVKGPLPLTTPARTLVDLAGCVGSGALERILARALRDCRVPPDEIRRLLDRYPRRPGRALLLGFLASENGPAFDRSIAERVFHERVRDAGLPPPRTNIVVHGFEVDCLWPGERLVVEIDGRRYHSDARAFERDRDRDTALLSAGYRVMRVTWKQITEEPTKVLVRLAAALARGKG